MGGEKVKESFEPANKQYEVIYDQLREVYSKLSQEKGQVKEYFKSNIIWEQVFPGVLLMKNIELINKHMKELLDMSFSLGKIEENHMEEISNSMENEIQQPSLEGEKKITNEEVSELALDIIKLRDQILIARYGYDDKRQRILASVYEELGRILKVNGIEPLEEKELFNSEYHIIIGTKVTNNIKLDNTIAEIYRPGYRTKNKILRAQEVVIYKYDAKGNDT